MDINTWNTGRNFTITPLEDENDDSEVLFINHDVKLPTDSNDIPTDPDWVTARECVHIQVTVQDNDDNTCSVEPGDTYRDIDLIAQMPNEPPQKLLDMGLITPIGMQRVAGPTLNATRVGAIIQWGSLIRVKNRLVFPQTNFSDQVWYELEDANGDSIGWIIARYEDVGFTGLGGDPCADETFTELSSLTFPYDRRAAANYAIEHSYQNTELPNPLIGNRVTRRLASNGSQEFIPFANFYYSYLTGDPNETGSAMFVSEAIWVGGLPMIIGETNSCSDQFLFNQSGWRYCSANLGSSNAWDYHQALVPYFTNTQAPVTVNGNNVINILLALSGENGLITFPSVETIHDDRIWGGRELPESDPNSDFLAYIPDLRDGIVADVPGLSGFVSRNLSQVVAGDYVLIDPRAQGAHGLLVVGWGNIRNCPVVLKPESRLNINNLQPSFEATSENYVPYVVDFTRAQSPVPRPFYCTMYNESDVQNFARHDWYFYRLPDQLLVNVSGIEPRLYVDPNWQWNNTDGLSNP